MACSQSSTTSSGNFSQPNATSNEHYACYCSNSCNDGHALHQCPHGIHELQASSSRCLGVSNESQNEELTGEWSRTGCVYTPACPSHESFKRVARRCDDHSFSISLIQANLSEKKSLDQLKPPYMYISIFKDIVFEIDEDPVKSIEKLIDICRDQNVPEVELQEFKAQYSNYGAVWWYTREMFLYGMLNEALEKLNMELMSKLGFFIRSLHLQLSALHQQQLKIFKPQFLAYRGQGINPKQFESLFHHSKNGLLSFSNFLSTSIDKEIAMGFVERAIQKDQSTIGILFVIQIDVETATRSGIPFAFIQQYSAIPTENEVLFTMNTIFRVVDVKQMDGIGRKWEVNLIITDESDPQLATLANRMRGEVSGSTSWYRMGKLMFKVGQFNQAEKLYQELLQNAETDCDKAYIYHELGKIRGQQGRYREELQFYERTVEINRKTLPEDDLVFSFLYNNIGLAYNNLSEYQNAIQYYEKSLNIELKHMAEDDASLAFTYNNMGLTYDKIGEYRKALEYYRKALIIFEKTLPWNHPNLATSYNNIGLHYDHMHEYPKALEYYEKTLKIFQQVLPSDHKDLATLYNNIGLLYDNMGEYRKALSFLQMSLTIWHKSLPTDANIIRIRGNIAEIESKLN